DDRITALEVGGHGAKRRRQPVEVAHTRHRQCQPAQHLREPLALDQPLRQQDMAGAHAERKLHQEALILLLAPQRQILARWAGAGALEARSGRAASRIMPTMIRSRGVAGARGGATLPARPAGRLCVTALCIAAARAALAQSPDASDWGYYGGDAFGQRFSSLDEINRTNVSRLSVAWTYRTAELGAGLARAGQLTFEATPVLAL